MPEQLAPEVSNFLAKEQRIQQEGRPIAEKIQLPTVDQISPELISIANEIIGVSRTLNPVEIFTADAGSIAVEKEKVFAAFDQGEEYNPELTYTYTDGLDISTPRQALQEQMRRLRRVGQEMIPDKSEDVGSHALDRGSRLFKTALYFKLKDDLATCDLVDGIKAKDESKISSALQSKYAKTDATVVDLAEQIFEGLATEKSEDQEEGEGILTSEQKEFIRNMKFDATGIKSAFEWALSKYGILHTDENPRGYKVKIDKNATSIDVRDKSAEGSTVFIPEDRVVDGQYLLELIAHEIEGHAVASYNGWELFMVGGGPLKIDEEAQYEGRGLRGEGVVDKTLFGIKDSGPLPYFTLAAKKAEEGSSFYDVFCDQVERRLRVTLKKPLGNPLPEVIDPKALDAAKKSAWLTTYRVMRGHTDMSNKQGYAMAKDIGYLRGYQVDKQLVELGYGYLNEAAIVASGALQLMAEVDLSEDKLPLKFKNVATEYCLDVLLPQMEQAS